MSSSAIVLVVLVTGVIGLGFVAAAWGRASLTVHEEWALAGRRFGTLVAWFLIGGDLYTASTFIALPALVYGMGGFAFFQFEHDRYPIDALTAKRLTLAMCFAALLIVVFLPVTYALDFQLIGGAIVLQIFPAFVLGLWTRWLHVKALLAGWACGLVASCAMTVAAGFTSTYPLVVAGYTFTGFIALYGLLVNIAVAAAVNPFVRAHYHRTIALAALSPR